jgi:hypothetical protein
MARSDWAKTVYDRAPATEKERADMQYFLYWKFPHLKAMEDLRKELSLVPRVIQIEGTAF